MFLLFLDSLSRAPMPAAGLPSHETVGNPVAVAVFVPRLLPAQAPQGMSRTEADRLPMGLCPGGELGHLDVGNSGHTPGWLP